MGVTRCVHAGLTLVLASSNVFAADRLTDRDVVALVERIDHARDQFENALDDEIKRKVLRGPTGEVDVDRYLDDFDQNIDRLKDRLKPEYSASAEAATVLRQASSIDAFFRNQTPGIRGESEWNRLATDMKSLAAAYGTDFPVTESAPVRRMGDREMASIAEQLSRGADQLKKSLDSDLKKNSAVDSKARQSMVSEADQLARDAKTERAIERRGAELGRGRPRADACNEGAIDRRESQVTGDGEFLGQCHTACARCRRRVPHCMVQCEVRVP